MIMQAIKIGLLMENCAIVIQVLLESVWEFFPGYCLRERLLELVPCLSIVVHGKALR